MIQEHFDNITLVQVLEKMHQVLYILKRQEFSKIVLYKTCMIFGGNNT